MLKISGVKKWAYANLIMNRNSSSSLLALIIVEFSEIQLFVSSTRVKSYESENCEHRENFGTLKMNGTERVLNDDIQLVRQGYERFFDGEITDDINDDAIVSVRRQQEITTLIGKNSEQNKIKISLSQEQIVRHTKGLGSNGVKRSQSVNIQKIAFAPNRSGGSHFCRGQSMDAQNQSLVLRRPSMIPIKINDQSSSSRMYSSLVLPERRTIRRAAEMYKSELLSAVSRECEKSKTARKFSMPNSELHSIGDNKNHAMSSLPYFRAEAGPQSGAFGILERKAIGLDDKFKCRMCHSTLNDPRVLDCLHTFCLECLFDMEQPAGKANAAKVNVVSSSRENSEMDMSGSSRTYSLAKLLRISPRKFPFHLFCSEK